MATKTLQILGKMNPSAVTYIPQNLTEEQQAQARKNIGINNDPNIHAEYFQITDDGIISLKSDYRGATAMGGIAGSKNAELPKHLIVPEIVDNKVVLGLAAAIFRFNNAIESVTLPSTIADIPDYCFDRSLYLKNVYNTENIKSIGQAAFQGTSIIRINFPNLEKIDGTNTFYLCTQLVYADIGKMTSLSNNTFASCYKLNMIKSENLITEVGNKCFSGTRNLQHADFSGLTTAGSSSFLRSGVDFPEGLDTSGFDPNATYLQYSPTDYWSDCTFTPCKNPLPTHLCQQDERWADRPIGTSGKKYSAGCMFFSIMHIYCGLNDLSLSTVDEMEAEIERKDQTWLNNFVSKMDNDAKEQMEKLDLSAIPYGLSDSTTEAILDEDNLQDLYDALAAKKYILMGWDENSNHVVVIYGINEKGELLVADSENASWINGKREPLKYALPIYKLRAQKNSEAGMYAFFVVSLKDTE